MARPDATMVVDPDLSHILDGVAWRHRPSLSTEGSFWLATARLSEWPEECDIAA